MSTRLPPDPAMQMAAELADARPGWELVGFLELALPYWRIRTRVRLLARKRIGPIDEYILRAVRIGVTLPADVGALLGLDEPVLQTTVVGLLQSDALRMRGDQLALTPSGELLADDCMQTVSQVRTIDVDWDGLLRAPVASLTSWLEPRDLRSTALREVPPTPAARPDVEELRSGRDGIERLVRQGAAGRADKLDLLDVGGVDRRFRIFRPAVGLAFQSSAGRDIQVAVAIDGRLSEPHESAFTRAGLPRRFGIGERGLPSTTQTLRVFLDQLEDETQEVAPQRHRELLELALVKSSERLVILGIALRSAVIDGTMLDLLEGRLAAGAQVVLGYGSRARPGADADPAVLAALSKLAAERQGLSVRRIARAHASVLVSDHRMAIVTGFDLLGYRGDPTAGFSDQRGRLITASDAVEQVHERLTTLLASGVDVLQQ